MPKPSQNPFPFAETIGAAVRRAKQERELSDSKLARMSGVSRRHLVELMKGANVTLSVAQRVMAALGLRELSFGPEQGLTLGDTPITSQVHRQQIEVTAEELEQSCLVVNRAAARLRSLAPAPAKASSARKRKDPVAQAASLTEDFARQIASFGPQEREAALQRLIAAATGIGSTKTRKRRSLKVPESGKTGRTRAS